MNDKCVNWKNKFFKTIPKSDGNGKPIPWNPPLNSGFFLKKKDTAGELSDQIKLTQEKHDKQRRR